MIRNYLQHGIKYSFISVSSLFGGDQLDKTTETERKADLSIMKEETGWDRVKQMFEIDEFGNITREVNSVIQVGVISLFVGAIYGGYINSKSAYMEFMKNNQATSFKNHFEAKKKLQDTVTISFGKGAFKWGWRLALFSSSFVGISTAIQVYRGKYGIMEYVAAGGITGAMYKFNLGPRGWIVGGGLGSTLGLLCGGITIGILNLTGISMEEARYWQSYWKGYRQEYVRKGIADYLEREDYAIVKLHNDKVGEEGKSISNLDKSISDSDVKDSKTEK